MKSTPITSRVTGSNGVNHKSNQSVHMGPLPVVWGGTFYPPAATELLNGIGPSAVEKIASSQKLNASWGEVQACEFWRLWRFGHSKPSKRMNAHFSAIEPWPLNEKFTGVWGLAQTRSRLTAASLTLSGES